MRENFEEKLQTNTDTPAAANSAVTDCINTGRYNTTQDIEMEILNQIKKEKNVFTECNINIPS